MKRHKNDEMVLMEDIKVLFADTYLHFSQEFEFENPLTFGDILNKCREKGYERRVILLIAESYLGGTIYRYGNYKDDDEWIEVGTMEGFA